MEAEQSELLEVAYLLVDGQKVYEMLAHTSLTIGRLTTNSISLDDYRVSREHAVLKFNGHYATLIDLASTHGTTYRGELVNKVDVPIGDTFQVVSHEFQLLREKPTIAQHGQMTEIVPSAAARSLDRRVKFFGGLNEFCLITLVQFLAQEKQNGLLMLEVGQKPGPRLYFCQGDIIHVDDQDDSLGKLLTCQNHTETLFFYFHHETEFPVRSIFQPTANFLMELCHQQDIQLNKNNETARLPSIDIARLRGENGEVKKPKLVQPTNTLL